MNRLFPQLKKELPKIPLLIRLSLFFFAILFLIAASVFASHLWGMSPTTETNLKDVSFSVFLLSIAGFSLFSTIVWGLVVFHFNKFYAQLETNEKERDTAVEALKSSEFRARELFENANDIFYTTDLQGNFTSLNKVGEQITGYSVQETLTKNISDVIAPEYLEFTRKMIDSKLADDSTTRYEIEIITKSGERLAVELSSRLIYEDSKPVGIQGIARDVTLRRRNEEKLKKSEAKYRSLIDSLPAIVYVVEPEPPFKPVYVSPNIETFGYTANAWSLVPNFWKTIIYPEDRELFNKQTEESMSNDQKRELEYRIFAADGSIKWIYDRGSFVHDESGNKLYWQGVMLDITENKIAEDAIRESEQIYRFLSEGIIHQVWTAHPNGKLDYVNDRTTKYFGCSAQELLKDGWKNFVHPEDLEDCLRKWKHSLETGDYFECRFRLKREDGEYLWYIARATPEIDSRGKIFKWLGTNTDIDEQVRVNAALRESETKFRTLLQNMSEGLLQVNKDFVIEFVNDRFCEMTGFPMDELVGKSMHDLLYDEKAELFMQGRNKRRLEGISENYELGLRKKNGELLWVLVGGAPTIGEDGSITGSMGVFTDITERKLAEEKLIHDAFHDVLTGLANRALFTDHLRLRIERAKREANPLFAVLFLDFDRFKVINDSLGHAEGDKLLIAVANRLESTLRSSDLIARLGGDEFTILLNELDEPEHAAQIAARIQELLNTPFELAGGEIFMSASIGIALGTDGKTSAEDMLRNADIAMYRAKSKGKARHQVFDQAMHDEALTQLQIETDLRQALGKNEFCLHYQPIYELETKTLVGFEALVRWLHPKRGIISPNQFISIAEENGLIISLGRWIIYESCRQMRQWQDTNPDAMNLTMSVNLSCKQFLQNDLAEQVMSMLVATRLDPEYLKLEITESHVMENSEAAVKMMNRLRSFGIELSLDDFGTGYSSLSYLHRLPVTNLKIDRSFINQMVEGDENSKLVSTIISLAHNLNINVTAEGVETSDQLIQLREFGCEKAQGYFFSKPLKAEEATELINNLSIPINTELTKPDRNLDLIG